jgi:hypothetical protein
MIGRIAIACAVAGCAHSAAIPPVPGQGGPAWIELTSEHFTLWTDAPIGRARELMREMENLRQVVIGTAFRSVAGPGRSFVIALRDSEEVHGYIPPQFGAISSPPYGNPIHQGLILLPAESKNQADEITEAHELTHVISHAVIHHQPRWFGEGLAKYFETIQIDRSAGTVDLGRAPGEQAGRKMVIHHLIPIQKMFACKDLTCADAGFYATAWALFTYLFNTHAEQLARLEKVLAEADTTGQPVWDQVFPELPVDKLEVDLRQWIVSGSHKVLHFNVKLEEVHATERALGDAEVYAARALIEMAFAGRVAAADANVAAALRIESTNVLALVVGHALHQTIDAAQARAAATAHPDDWRAWMLLSIALKTGDEATQAHAKACELAAQNPALAPPCKP